MTKRVRNIMRTIARVDIHRPFLNIILKYANGPQKNAELFATKVNMISASLESPLDDVDAWAHAPEFLCYSGLTGVIIMFAHCYVQRRCSWCINAYLLNAITLPIV